MDKQTVDSNEITQPTPSSTDDESLSTSTASFESWTIINDKQKDQKTTQLPSSNTTTTTSLESHVENLPVETAMEASEPNTEEEQEDEPPPDYESATITSAADELSDEVSIISDSDGGEVLSPHPYLLDHLHKLNLKFTTGEGLDLATLLQQQQQEEHRLQLQQQQQESTPPNTPIFLPRSNNSHPTQMRQRKRRSPSADVSQKLLRNQEQAIPSACGTFMNIQRCVLFKRICQLLYNSIALVLTILCVILLGNWLLTGYRTVPLKSANNFEQKINDLELQNNLMRAEIDFLSKQINYLNTFHEKKHTKGGVWLNEHDKRNHDKYESTYETEEPQIEKPNMNPNVEETESILREQDSNDEGIFVEEFTFNPEDEDDMTIIQPIKIKNKENYDSEKQTIPTEERQDNQEYRKHKQERNNFKEKNPRKDNSEERLNKNNKNKERINKKFNSKESHNDDSNESKDENHNFNNYNDNERNNFKKHNNKPEHKERNNIHKIRKNKNNDNDNSDENENLKERKYRNNNFKDRENNFKTRSNNNYKKKTIWLGEENQQKFRKSNSGERFNDRQATGEWHQKLMQQREKARHNQEQNLQQEKNWYLNRNDGREQWRVEDFNLR